MACLSYRGNRTKRASVSVVLRSLGMLVCIPSLAVGCLEKSWVEGPVADNGVGHRPDADAGVQDEACVPGGTAQRIPETAREYVVMCEPELGVPPELDCSAGVTIPITVDGAEVTELLPNFVCDNPGLQAGGCVPGTTINRVTGRTREGVERPEVVWVQFCSSEDGVSKGIRGVPVWENVVTRAQMIGYNDETGATCFFELNFGPQEQWVGRDENGRASGVLPNYDEPEFDRAFVPGEQCVSCHQNDAFIHNPWVDGARLPSNPNEAVLPVLPANSPYYVVGGSDWDMRTIHIEGNACLTCHRASMTIDAHYRSLGFDVNQWMPVHDPGSLAEDYAALTACYENGPENTPGCDWVVPPGGGCEGGVVGPDYPNAGGGDDDKGGDDLNFEECPEGFDPESGSACEGDWQSTVCDLQGVIWWCEAGEWMQGDDKEGDDKEGDDGGDCAELCDLEAALDCPGDDPSSCVDSCEYATSFVECKAEVDAVIACFVGLTEADLICGADGKARSDGQCDAEESAVDACFEGLP